MVAYLRANALASIYDCAMTVPLCQQVISVLDLLTGREGTEGVKRYVDCRQGLTS
jgi:hypothetical protein